MIECHDAGLQQTNRFKEREAGFKRHPLLKILPNKVKRVLFIVSLYSVLCRFFGVKPNLKSVHSAFEDLIPTPNSCNLPHLLSDRLWKESSIHELTITDLVGNQLVENDFYHLSPPWMRYKKVDMIEDAQMVFMLVFTDYGNLLAEQSNSDTE